MQIGMIGLGKMGANMARRLARGGARVIAYDRGDQARAALHDEAGARPVASLDALAAALTAPRVIWMMLPAGDASAATIEALGPMLAPGDVLIDGANAHYKDSMRRAAELKLRGIEFIDVGVSGGIWGLQAGYGLMIGGSQTAVARIIPFIRLLAPSADSGWTHCGGSGSGHFVKMIHNGIEYGLMQAYAEGFALLRAKPEFDLDLAAIAESWRHGSVIRSWLLELTAQFLSRDHALEDVAPVVADSGEGRWTALEAIQLGVPVPVISAALMMRFASQGRDDYAARLLAKMRQSFGGHKLQGEPRIRPAPPPAEPSPRESAG